MTFTGLPLAMAEVAARQVYWRAPWLVEHLATLRAWSASAAREKPTIAPRALMKRIGEAVDKCNGLLMVHSSLNSFTIQGEDGRPMRPAQAALWLIETLTNALEPDGTLCMPTHPLYPEDPGFMFDKSDLVLKYRVDRTPASTGLLPEMFRRSSGVRRSRHPLSSLAARGPSAERLLDDNLNDRRPLPHGRDSGYYRCCQLDGGILGLGVSLIKALTILHVPEEVRDETWPVQGFFQERLFDIQDNKDEPVRVVVRERRPEFVRSLALSLVRKNLVREGILEEVLMSGVRCDYAQSGKLLRFFEEKQRQSTYPYFLPRLAGWGRPPKVPPAKQARIAKRGREPTI